MTYQTFKPTIPSVNQMKTSRIFPHFNPPVSLLEDKRFFPIPNQTESEVKVPTTHPKSSEIVDKEEARKKERKAAKIKERDEKLKRHHQRKALLLATDVIENSTCAILSLPLILVTAPFVALTELVRIYIRYLGKVDERDYDSDYDDTDDESEDEPNFVSPKQQKLITDPYWPMKGMHPFSRFAKK